MELAIYSRFFSTINGGQGRVSLDLADYFSKKEDIQVIKNECKSKGNIGYLYHSLIGKHIDSADVNLAITSMESMKLNPSKSVAIVHDLIPLLDGWKFETHYMKGNMGPYNMRYWVNRLGALWFFGATLARTKEFQKVICISEETKEDYLQVTGGDPEKVEVIENWVQDKYTYQQPSTNEKTIIGTLSYLDPRKRIDILVNEFKKIKDDSYELWIGGGGCERYNLEKLAGNDSRIKFLGRVPEEDMVSFYKNIDIFVFPTLCEGFGIPIVEASACGRPVITLNDSKIPKVVQDLTNSVPKDKLSLALQNYSKQDIIHQGKIVAKKAERFRMADKMEKYEKIIREVGE
jgi:glycosyltransferase involved in cell wall biosynthesis